MSALTTYTVHRSGDWIEVSAKLPSGRPASVTGSLGSRFGQPPEFQVNWSAIGSVSAEDAAAYAAMIAFVADQGPALVAE